MRTPLKWSAVSLAMTVPTPVQGEPRRPLSGIAHLLEITGVDLVEAGGGKADAEQLGLDGKVAGDLGTQIALTIDTVEVRPERLHPDDSRQRDEAARDLAAARLHIDDVTAAQHPAGQLRDRAGQRDAAAIEQGDAIAHALHLVEVVRRQQDR